MGTPAENKALMREFVAQLNARDEDAMRRYSDSEHVLRGAIEIMHALPDARFEERWMIAEGDLVCAFQEFQGTHRGPFAHLREGTGRHVKAAAMICMRVEDGKFVDVWLGTNPLSILMQLEAVELVTPSPA